MKAHRTAIRWFFGIAFIVVFVSNAVHGRAAEDELREIASNELQQRGKQLRAAFQQTYLELEHKLYGTSTDITESVLPYVAPGISFRNAETILRNAGFTVEYPDLNQVANPNRGRDWYVVMARISPFASPFPSRVDAYVLLFPMSPGDYTTVAKVSAGFFVVSL
jgi:plasmid stability protein